MATNTPLDSTYFMFFRVKETNQLYERFFSLSGADQWKETYDSSFKIQGIANMCKIRLLRTRVRET